ncbi:hypothetical protein G9A89_006064 [Geosiphon pyriformis]|nr:hypothetical protein G9A89_006064 [Geosiphon pyriformis]
MIFFAITISQRRFIDPTNPIRVDPEIIRHSSSINCINWSQFSGIRFSTLFLTIAHKFSIGFKSGELAGQSRTLLILTAIKAWETLLLCFGSLSCWNRHLRPSIPLISGRNHPKQRLLFDLLEMCIRDRYNTVCRCISCLDVAIFARELKKKLIKCTKKIYKPIATYLRIHFQLTSPQSNQNWLN